MAKVFFNRSEIDNTELINLFEELLPDLTKQNKYRIVEALNNYVSEITERPIEDIKDELEYYLDEIQSKVEDAENERDYIISAIEGKDVDTISDDDINTIDTYSAHLTGSLESISSEIDDAEKYLSELNT